MVETDAQIDHALLHPAVVALGDPTRMAILKRLRIRDHCVCHLVEYLELKQSVVSHHVGILRRAGLVDSYPHPFDRRWLYYRLNRDTLATLSGYVSWLLDDTEYNREPLPCAADERTSDRLTERDTEHDTA